MAAGRRARLTLFLVFLFVVQGLQVLPPASAQDQAAAPAPQPVVAVDLTPADRVPVPAPVDFNGVLSPDTVTPDPGSATSPQALVQDEVPAPKAGDVNMDVYRPEAGVGSHFALVSDAIFNTEGPDGTWADASLVADDYGWSLSTPDFAVRFPAVLSSATPVIYEMAGGKISAVPSGAQAKGSSEATGVTYPGALPGTDVAYEVFAEGFKESFVLAKGASGKLSWDVSVSGFSLVADASGAVAVMSGATRLAEMPAPTVSDSASPPSTTTPKLGLESTGDGTFRITLSIDPAFLEQATYPIVVDPGTRTESPSADTYANGTSGNKGKNYGNDTTFRTGPSGNYLAFIKFPTTWHRAGLLVYSAELWVKNISEGNGGANVIAKRITAGWTEGALTWSNKPGVSTTPIPVNTNGPTGDWFTFELKDLYQRYNDATYSDYGVRLESSDQKTFSSKEASCTPSCDPYLALSFNDLPDSPSLDGPADGRALESGTPTLRIGSIPPDFNGDEVLVRYQVTGTQGDWSAAKESVWTDETRFEVPTSWLTDGGTYWWRVQAADVCTQPDSLCSRVDGTGDTRAWPASNVFNFTLLKRNWGDDERYAAWSQDLGNGMAMHVNEANGNLHLDVPIDSVRTPIGNLRVGLSYNSQAAEEQSDYGLGPGWHLYAGPESSGRKLPIRLEDLGSDEGVKIHLRGGGSDIYPWRGGNTYGSIGQGSGVVRENENGTWTYRTPDGDVYSFTSAGRLDKAKPVFSKDKVSQSAPSPNFRYEFNAQDHLTKVTDPIGRDVVFDWTGSPERLTGIHLWGHDFALGYSGGTLTSITTPEQETLRFYHNDTCDNASLLSQVRNGQQSADSTDGWRISHIFDQDPGPSEWEVCRAKKLFPPGRYTTGPSGNFWSLAYGSAGYKGTTSLQTLLTDPRGNAGQGIYQAVIDFNDGGLPIRHVAPEVASSEPDWISSQVFDSNGNLLCSRSPQANALAGGQNECRADDTTDQFNTVYDYYTTEPYLLKKVTNPAPSDQATRERTRYDYDGGATFSGLWAESFENPNLAGIPDDEGLWSDLSQPWGAGAPPNIASNDNWSVRLSGLLKVAQTQRYDFRLTHDDGVALTIGNKVLVYCFSSDYPGGAENCNQGTVEKKLWSGERPITIEFREGTGDARLKVEWRPQGGSWEVIPPDKLIPNLGLLTSATTEPDTGGNNLALDIQYGYPSDDAKARRLPTFKERRDSDPGYTGADDTRRSEFEYDDYGRRTKITRYAQTAFEAITRRTYTDDAGAKTSCLTKATDPTGAVTEFTCSKWGDVTEQKVVLREVSVGGTVLQAAQNRVTATTYDAMGRPTVVDHAGPGLTDYDYDASGRVTQVRVLLVQGSPDRYATTSFAYDDYASPPTMTETLPDPNPSGSPDSPVITHTYDYLGNETSRTDARNANWVWSSTYDAQNRVISTTTPDPDGSGALTPLTTQTSYSVDPFYTKLTDPAGVETLTSLDYLGRVASTQTGTMAPAAYTYTYRGDLKRQEVSSAGTTYTWSEHAYNAFGKPISDTAPFWNGTSVQSVTTDYTYNAAGWLKQADGPLSANDLSFYDYDLGGRITLSRYWISGSQSYDTEVTYNDAAEQLQVKTQLDATRWQKRRWTYTAAGQLDTYTELHGGGVDYVTDNAYDAAGRLTSVADPRGCSVSLGYDDLSRLTSRDGASCGGELSFSYLADGSLESTTNVETGIYYDLSYDRAARLEKTFRNGSGSAETTYTYNSIGQLSSVQTAAGTTSLSYFTSDGSGGYEGLLKDVDDPLITGTPKTTYTYDAAGRVSTRTDESSNVTWTRTYEPETGRADTQRIVKNPGTELGEFDLDYDRAGNVTSRYSQVGTATSDARNGTWSYVYDAASRLSTATGPDPADPNGTPRTWGFAYDGAGNRTSYSVGATTYTYTTDDQGWPTAFDNGTPADSTDDTAYTWDEAGNLELVDAQGSSTTNDWRYTTDAFGWLTDADKGPAGTPSLSIDYTLDPFGRIASRSGGGTTTSFAYEGTGETLAKAASGASTTLYAYAPGGVPLIQQTDGSNRYLLRDLHSDVVGTIGPSQSAPAARAYYSPFGEATWSSSATSLGFQGDWTDADTAQVDMGTRMYVPALGRFSSRDALSGEVSDPLSLNQFAYANANPVSYWDPTGMAAAPLPPNYKPCTSNCPGMLDTFQFLLDLAGAIPVIGEPADLLNAGIYAARGRELDALASLAGATIVGEGGKWAGRACREFCDELVEGGAKLLRHADDAEIASRLQRYADEAARKVELTKAQDMAARRNPRLQPAFYGERVDAAVRQSITQDEFLTAKGSLTPRGQFGPDYISNTGRWYDVTTPASWPAHVARYEEAFGSLYQRILYMRL